jgi:hypothetical protein
MAKYKLTSFLKEGEFKFKPTETDAPGMQARPDGYLKEEFKYFDNYEDFESTLFQLYPQVKANPEKYKKDGIDGEVRYSDGYVNWASWNPNRPQSPSGLPPGAVNMNNKMTQSDLIYPPGSRMDEKEMEESIDFNHLMKVRAGIIK